MKAFRSPLLCAPIEYGQIIDLDTHVLPQTSVENIEQFGLHVSWSLDRRTKASQPKSIFFPASLVQIHDLPYDVAHALNELDFKQRNEYYHDSTHSVSRDTDLYWLDLSQLQINPYLNLLFSDENRILHHLGRCEIRLRTRATLDTLVLDSLPSNSLLVEAIGTMQVTHPPCRSLGIYYYDNSGLAGRGTHPLLRRIRNDDGISVTEQLIVLQDYDANFFST
jgi:hypothetical protein